MQLCGLAGIDDMNVKKEITDLCMCVVRSRSRAICGILICAAFLTGLVIEIRNRPMSFDSTMWRERPTKRARCVENLVKSGMLRGVSKSNVLQLLGRADHAWKDKSNGHEHLVYWVGTDGVIDDLWLDIDLADTRVAAVGIRPD